MARAEADLEQVRTDLAATRAAYRDMQALDTTIANVALPHMQGSMGATQDQIAWVLTSYIVAAAIFMPLTGFITARLGRKRVFMWSVVGFTVASMFCGAAQNLDQIVVFRLLQGIFGASLVPLSQAVLLDTYPRERHGAAMAMWGVGVMVGPILGPSLGGWLTEYYNWRWVFYINLPFGLLAWAGLAVYVRETPIDLTRRFDWLGFSLLSVALWALQLMLDRGGTLNWFTSPAGGHAGLSAGFPRHDVDHPRRGPAGVPVSLGGKTNAADGTAGGAGVSGKLLASGSMIVLVFALIVNLWPWRCPTSKGCGKY